jgi:ATP-dependent HslUV protease ATP-binding subunit HslU
MGGMDPGMDGNFMDMLQDMLPKRTKRRTVTVAEARRILVEDELDKLVNMDEVVNEALDRVEEMGIIFLDEIDKIAGDRGPDGPRRVARGRAARPPADRRGLHGADQVRDGAHRPHPVHRRRRVPRLQAVDLIPELQGRFPIRVELKPLTEQDFVRILTEPKNALTKQYSALVAAEGATLEFTDDGVAEIARIASAGERPDGEHRRAAAAHGGFPRPGRARSPSTARPSATA